MQKAKDHVPFDDKKYGFNDSRLVGIAGFPPLLSFETPPETRAMFLRLFQHDQYPLNDALEILTRTVNDSMEYDMPKAVQKMLGTVTYLVGLRFQGEFAPSVPIDQLTDSLIEPITGLCQDVEAAKYVPKGIETMTGICADAGDYIRCLLEEILVDPVLRYCKINVKNTYPPPGYLVGGHDVTQVFDIKTGNWIILNSKSPRLFYNIVPKENLAELGPPFAY